MKNTITSKKILPFGMLNSNHVGYESRGYKLQPTTWNYDPIKQISDIYRMGGGSSSPATWSTCETTFPILQVNDSDNGKDDTGND